MKFTIRDLVLVTFIVAFAVGWWVERRGRVQQELKFKKMFLEQAAEMTAMNLELVKLRRAAGESGVEPLGK